MMHGQTKITEQVFQSFAIFRLIISQVVSLT